MGLIGDGFEIMKLANIAANADLHEKIGRYVEKVQELQIKVEALETENKDLTEKLKFKGTFSRTKGIAFVDGDEEAICGRCAEVDNRPVHIVERFGAHPKCPHCKTEFDSLILRTAIENRQRSKASQSENQS